MTYLPYLYRDREFITQQGDITMQDVIYLLKYFGVVFTDGDWHNDWLTWLPVDVAGAAKVIGEWVAPLFS